MTSYLYSSVNLGEIIIDMCLDGVYPREEVGNACGRSDIAVDAEPSSDEGIMENVIGGVSLSVA